MEALKIEILNRKALQLIKVNDDPASALKTYLKKRRRSSASVPTVNEIAKIVDEVRAKRYAKK